MTLPNFLVIGAARSGTTTLYYCLKNHPQVYVTPVLEPRFFAFEGDKVAFDGPGDGLLKRRIITKLDDYAELFDRVTDEIAIGEVSPAYLTSESAPIRIRHYVPNAKIIAVLRNPVERAMSSFRLEVLQGLELVDDFATALRQEECRMKNNWSYVWQYKRRGCYYTQLKRYFDLFAKEQIKVFLFEDWKNGVELLKKIFRFLGVNETAAVQENIGHHNSTANARFESRGMERPELSADVRLALIEEYREEVDKLQDLIDCDLSSWLTASPGEG